MKSDYYDLNLFLLTSGCHDEAVFLFILIRVITLFRQNRDTLGVDF